MLFVYTYGLIATLFLSSSLIAEGGAVGADAWLLLGVFDTGAFSSTGFSSCCRSLLADDALFSFVSLSFSDSVYNYRVYKRGVDSLLWMHSLDFV